MSKPSREASTTDASNAVQKISRGDELAQGRDLAAENRRKLAELFPSVLTETAEGVAVDAAVLAQLVGAVAEDDRRERFGLSWHGKSAARRLALTPSTGTLRPAPGESVDWETTGNVLIEGDNLEVLKLLQKAYAGKVKLIYIDPPYNTGNDFVYEDDFADPIGNYRRTVGIADSEGVRLTSNSESGGRFHTGWLNLIYPRLLLARELLNKEGIIVVSIDDNELSHLRVVLDEMFGKENFLATFLWKKMDSPSRNDEERIVSNYHDYLVAYARDGSSKRLNKRAKPEILEAYPLTLADGRLARRRQLRKNGKGARREDRPTMWFPLTAPDGTEVWPKAPPPDDWDGRWVLSLETWREREAEGLTEWIKRDHGWVPYYIETAPDNPTVPWPTWWDDLPQNRQSAAAFTELMGQSGADFDNPKPVDLLRRLLALATTAKGGPDGPDIVMDFFAGSGSTGHAVYEQNTKDGGNRRFVLVQLDAPTGRSDFKRISDLTAERLRRAGRKSIEEQPAALEGEITESAPGDTGFRVFKLDTANVKAWEAPTTDALKPETIEQLLQGNVDAVRPERSEADLLWGAMLNLGLPLDGKVITREVDGKTVYVTGGGTLLACFAASFDLKGGERLATGLAEIARELGVVGEITALLRDAAFGGNDAAKVNLVENLKQRMPDGVTARVRSI